MDAGGQRFDLAAQGVLVQQPQVAQVLYLVVQLLLKRVTLLLQLRAQGVYRIVAAGLSRVQLLFQLGQLRLQRGESLLHQKQHVAVGGIHTQQSLQGGKGVGHLLALVEQLLLLFGQLLYGGFDLVRALVDGVDGVVDLLEGLLSGPGQRVLAVGQLGLGVVQLALYLGKLRVDVLQNGVVQHVDAALLDGDVHPLLDHARSTGRGHAVQGLEGGHQLVLHVIGEGQYVHVVLGDGEYRHGQHVRVQLHGHRRADLVAPVAPQLVQPGGDLDQCRVHVRAVVELHDHNGYVVPGRGGDLLHVCQRGEGSLHRAGDLRFHLLRRGAHIAGVHHHIGQVHAGQQIGGHLLERDDPQHDHQYDAHDHGVGLFHAVLGKHACLPGDNLLLYSIALEYELNVNTVL